MHVFANPTAIAVAMLAVWRLVHVIAGRHPSNPGSWSDLFGCLGCLAALAVVALGAVGHLVRMFVAGTNKDGDDGPPPR